MNRKELEAKGIKIRRFVAFRDHYSHIVYYHGIRCNPGMVQEDGFQTRWEAEKFAKEYLKKVKPGFRIPISSLFPRKR